MPKIPQYISTANIKQPNLPSMGGGDIESSRQAQKGIVGAIENAEDAIIKVRDFRQTAEASAYGTGKLLEKVAQYEADAENLDPSQYYSDIDTIKNEASKSITGRLAKEQFSFDFDRQAEAAKYKIRATYRTRELESADATLEYRKQQILDNPPEGDLADPLSDTTLASYRKQLEDAVTLGLYTRDKANMEWDKFINDLRVNKVRADIYNDQSTSEDDSEAFKQFKAGEEGVYKLIPQQDRINLTKEWQNRIFQNNQTYKRETENAVFDTRADTLSKVLSGEIDQKNYATMRDAIAETDKDLASAIESVFSQRARYEPIDPSKATDALINLTDALLKSNNKKALGDFLNNAAKDKKINIEELSVLIDVARERAKELDGKGDFGSFLKSAIEAISHSVPLVEGVVLLRTLQRAKKEKSAPEQILPIAVDEIKKQAIQDNPDVTKFSKEGQLMMDANGNKAIVFPDGSFKEIE